MKKVLILFAHPALQKSRVNKHLIENIVRLGAKQRIEDLEKLLITEIQNVGKDKDLGWDATTLIEEFGEVQPDGENR